MKRRCVFLDRDGTLNKYKELICEKQDIILENKAADAIRLLNEYGYLCIVVTNQPGVAKNLCSLEEVWEINYYLEQLLKEKHAYLDDIFLCPHHPQTGFPEENKKYKVKCRCRKPDIGMIEDACEKYNIDIFNSYIIGDSTIDIKTGEKSNLKTILVKTGLKGDDRTFDVTPDFICDNLLEAAKLIIRKDIL